MKYNTFPYFSNEFMTFVKLLYYTIQLFYPNASILKWLIKIGIDTVSISRS